MALVLNASKGAEIHVCQKQLIDAAMESTSHATECPGDLPLENESTASRNPAGQSPSSASDVEAEDNLNVRTDDKEEDSAVLPDEAAMFEQSPLTAANCRPLNGVVAARDNGENEPLGRPVTDESMRCRNCISNQPFRPASCHDGPNCNARSMTNADTDLVITDCRHAAHGQQQHQHQQQEMLSRHQLNGHCVPVLSEVPCSGAPSSTGNRKPENMKTEVQKMKTTDNNNLEITSTASYTLDKNVSLTSSGNTNAESPAASTQDATPSVQLRPCSRKSEGPTKHVVRSETTSPTTRPFARRLNTSLSGGADETASNGDEGSGDDDEEDDGIYNETFRYSSYKFIGNNDADDDVASVTSPTEDVLLEGKPSERFQDGRVASSSSETKIFLDNHFEKKNHLRSMSMTTAEMKRSGNFIGRALNRKIIKRHISMGAETYQMPSEQVYEVERTLILKKPDLVTSFGFHLFGENPLVISTIEPGSIAELSGVKIGDRLVLVNGTNVVKASQETLIDIIKQSPNCLELGVASGALSRDTCICSGYLNLKPGGIMRNWKRRWCQLKYDGFLYYYKTDDCITPLGAISMSNYVIIRGSDCSQNSVFKLVKYGQKTYYIQADSDEEMNWWAGSINMAASKANSMSDAWLDISSHNVSLPALSIRSPECHGYLTKVGYRNANWRRRYCVLKSACLYYYKDQTSSTAKGVAHLHGYSVEEETMYQRRFGFMAVPPVAEMRTFHFTAENETGKQRWMAALRNSIGKWAKVED